MNIRKGLKERTITKPEDISVERCLEQGTIASLQNISPEYISDIVILGNPDYREYLLEGQYGVDASNWFKGFGIGETDMFEQIMLELSYFKRGNKLLDIHSQPGFNRLVKQIRLQEDGLSIQYEDIQS